MMELHFTIPFVFCLFVSPSFILGKMRKRGCIVSKLVAKMMCRSGLNHLITMDLHQKEIQGFFDCPVDNLRASPFLLQYIQECVRFKKIILKTNFNC